MRYQRLRREIEPPRALVAAAAALFSRIELVKSTLLTGARSLRRLLADLIDRVRTTRHLL